VGVGFLRKKLTGEGQWTRFPTS